MSPGKPPTAGSAGNSSYFLKCRYAFLVANNV